MHLVLYRTAVTSNIIHFERKFPDATQEDYSELRLHQHYDDILYKDDIRWYLLDAIILDVMLLNNYDDIRCYDTY